MKKSVLPAVMIVLAILGTQTLHAAGVIAPGTTRLTDNASASSPAMWYIDGDYDTPDELFYVGISATGDRWETANYNYLTITDGQTFTATNSLQVGTDGMYNAGQYNALILESGANVQVNGYLQVGIPSSFYNQGNRINITGTNAKLQITGNLDLSNGYNAKGLLTIADGGVVVVDSDKDGAGTCSLYNHWSYGNSFLELNGGRLFWYGDQTAAFDQGMLSSIKVWDDETAAMQRVAYYNSTTWYSTQYMDLLEIAYVEDAAAAAALGVSDEYIGFTVVQNTPEPATLSLLGLGGLMLRKRRK